MAGVAVASCNAVSQKFNLAGGQSRQRAGDDAPAACRYWINAKATESQEGFSTALAVPVGFACFDNSYVAVLQNDLSATIRKSLASSDGGLLGTHWVPADSGLPGPFAWARTAVKITQSSKLVEQRQYMCKSLQRTDVLVSAYG